MSIPSLPNSTSVDTSAPGASTLAEQLFRTLNQAILDGALAPGSKISEPLLARRYGVSRGPLREALHRLQERRLITRSANQGARVVELSAQGLAEIFTVREALEGIAAREAATKATPQERTALTEALIRHRTELSDTEGPNRPPLTANRDFHFLIAQASRNPLLIQLLCHELYPLLRLYRGRGADQAEPVWRALQEHQRILDAIEDQDPEMAELQMRRHIAAARIRRQQALVPEVTKPARRRRADR
jgi:DNA-binding GntR family transcriptional regulator